MKYIAKKLRNSKNHFKKSVKFPERCLSCAEFPRASYSEVGFPKKKKFICEKCKQVKAYCSRRL
jgi:hypothetical protein